MYEPWKARTANGSMKSIIRNAKAFPVERSYLCRVGSKVSCNLQGWKSIANATQPYTFVIRRRTATLTFC